MLMLLRCCWCWKWWSKFAIAEWQRKTKFTILSNFKQSCAMIVQWWGKLCKVHLPDGDSKIKSGQTSNDPLCKQCKGATGVKSQKCQRSTKSLAKPIKKPTFPRMTHHRHHHCCCCCCWCRCYISFIFHLHNPGAALSSTSRTVSGKTSWLSGFSWESNFQLLFKSTEIITAKRRVRRNYINTTSATSGGDRPVEGGVHFHGPQVCVVFDDLVCVNLVFVDLVCVSLVCVNFVCVHLVCDNLVCVHLVCVNLVCVILACIDLVCVNLVRVDLACVNLVCVDLVCVDLACVNLVCVNLTCVNFVCVNPVVFWKQHAGFLVLTTQSVNFSALDFVN